eukprot:7568233-Pyramimonas_sp.AAC.1
METLRFAMPCSKLRPFGGRMFHSKLRPTSQVGLRSSRPASQSDERQSQFGRCAPRSLAVVPAGA